MQPASFYGKIRKKLEVFYGQSNRSYHCSCYRITSYNVCYTKLLRIPKISKSCRITEYAKTRLLLCYNIENENNESIKALAGQIISVLKNYMNIDISIGISNFTENGEDFLLSIEQANRHLSLRYVFGGNSYNFV